MSVDWESEGLLEGTEGKAREGRRQLLDELHESGVGLEELREAVEEGRLVLLPLEQALSGRRSTPYARGGRREGRAWTSSSSARTGAPSA